ncbi:hypothetical protein N8I77_012618 [Diaporthe amygdali]|uniref:Uncharacterized protein n=1 Tax=Phomopsis amygdali TaxID=1214568 RepID=A0AAD9S4D4_PHOAM|nr:hypothetical protein N8I77_012618 [Diaporthe amygdali]
MSGSAKKIAGPKKSSSWFRRVWVDRRRDTVVINMSQPASHVYKRKSIDFLSGLLRSREVHVALDLSWALCFCVVYKDQARELFRDFLHGHKECDFVIVDLQLDVTDEEAASTGLFGYSSTNTSVLVPIEDTCQMSRLFAAQAKFNTIDRLNKWANFTQFRRPANLIDYMKRWEKLGGREMGSVQQGLDFLAGVEVGWQEKEVGELRAQAARAAAIRANIPTLRPVIMVSRLAKRSI